MTPRGNFTLFPLSNVYAFPLSITAGPDGNIWFAEFYGDKIGRITPAGVITEFPVPAHPTGQAGSQPFSNPVSITSCSDRMLCFTDPGYNKIGRITSNGLITEVALPSHHENPLGSFPYGITVGPGDQLWFTEQTGMRIGRIASSGTITEFPLGVNHVATFITAGHDGNLWFLEPNRNAIGRITPTGMVNEFPLPNSDSNPSAIVAAPDGNVWFTMTRWSELGRITPEGIITAFSIPRHEGDSGPIGLTIGPDGALWFTTDRMVGRFTL